MADFSYEGKTLTVNGPLKTSGTNLPLNAKYRVDHFNDIDDIPTPAIGELIYVIQDETRNYNPSIYVVKSLKSNSFGVSNTTIREVDLLDNFLTDIDAKSVNGKDFWYGTQAEYNELAKISKNTIYIISDMEAQVGPTGPEGKQGLDGLSAYDIWITAPGNENKTQSEFIKSMQGEKGKSAYEVWLEITGFTSEEKSETDFIKSLVGASGETGKDGLTTSISLNGKDYTHVNGKITLPVNSGDSLLVLDEEGKISSSFLSDDINAGDAKTIDGKKIWCGTEEEYNIITNDGLDEDESTIYIIEDKTLTLGPTGPRGPQGLPGLVGPTGPTGMGLKILNVYNNEDEFNQSKPTNNRIGDCYLIGNYFYIWDGVNFIKSEDITVITNYDNEKIGVLSDLLTNDKSSLVAAINEVFQLGNSKKKALANAISKMGVEANASESWDELISKILLIKK